MMAPNPIAASGKEALATWVKMSEDARTTRLAKGEAAKAVRPPEATAAAGGWSHLTPPERPPKTHSLAVVVREIWCVFMR